MSVAGASRPAALPLAADGADAFPEIAHFAGIGFFGDLDKDLRQQAAVIGKADLPAVVALISAALFLQRDYGCIVVNKFARRADANGLIHERFAGVPLADIAEIEHRPMLEAFRLRRRDREQSGGDIALKVDLLSAADGQTAVDELDAFKRFFIALHARHHLGRLILAQVIGTSKRIEFFAAVVADVVLAAHPRAAHHADFFAAERAGLLAEQAHEDSSFAYRYKKQPPRPHSGARRLFL